MRARSKHGSIYSTLADSVRTSIRDQVYLPGQHIGSEHGLARQEGVSRGTVRKASELLVNEGLIERRPGKGLYVCNRRSDTEIVHVVVEDLGWEPWLQIALGISAWSKQAGIQIHYCDAQADSAVGLKMLRSLPHGPAKGAVVISVNGRVLRNELYGLAAQGFPIVLVDQRLVDLNVPSVASDNSAGGYLVGQMLIKKGHTRVGFIGNLSASSVQSRLEGLRDAFGDAGLPFNRALIAHSAPDEDGLSGDGIARLGASIRDLLKGSNLPTALFCCSDAIAQNAYRTATAMRLDIPGDVSIVGYDDAPCAEWLCPGLSTVRQDFRGMGRSAMELLRRRMTDPHAPVEHLALPIEYIERRSVASLAAERYQQDIGMTSEPRFGIGRKPAIAAVS